MGYRENFFKANKPPNGKYECAYCGEKLNKEEADVGHITLKSRGGSNSVSSITASCSHCNRQNGGVDNIDYEIHMDLTVLENEELFEHDVKKCSYEQAVENELKRPHIKGY